MGGISTIILFLAFCWGGFFLQGLLPITDYGIQPRSYIGLIGIAAGPFLHGNLQHLLANSAGLVTFGLIFGLLEGRKSTGIITSILVYQGALTWIFARQGNHIGASGIVFGLFGYLALAGFFRRKFVYIIVSLGVCFTYGSLIFGVLPLQPGISWESHLFGFIAGGICAKAREG